MYRRSPTCRFCYQKGHARNHCPAIAAKAAEAAEKPAEQRDYHEARAITLHQRNVAKAAAPRYCSYCGNEGHNRNGCGLLKTDIVRLADYNRRWKQHMAAWFASDACPVKIGALMEFSNWRGGKYTVIVTDVNSQIWNSDISNVINDGIQNWFVRGQVLSITGVEDMHGASVGNTVNFCAPAGGAYGLHNSYEPSVVISDGCLNVVPPTEWLESNDVSHRFAKGHTKRTNGVYYADRPNFEAIETFFKTHNIN
jgi:hypothetical protein